ncbi:MAG: UDP-N-acetylmuramoyl-L-alanine--D-glutamate ligase [Clostridia bacterium]|nr:UDP-N-acetylmuramoyl-L-alanine--D-glutamate ligase [Clostridia bacterium]
MDFSGRKVLVIGLARSGMAAIKVLKKLGAEVTLSESKSRDEIKEADALEALGVEIVNQDMSVFEGDYDLVVKNPGVPFRTPMIERLNERGIKIITEIELAYIVSKPQHYIAITGTNGKTTTTTLVYEILKKVYGDRALLCGNIGIPLCEMVMDYNLMENGGNYIALEISNFQLINIDRFTPDVATIINLTPDHIDFMGGLDNYYKSKTEVYRNMTGDRVFLKNADDPAVAEYTEKYPVKCRTLTFSVESENADCVIKDGFVRIDGENVLPADCIKLVGRHNLQNVIIAVAAAKAAGVDNESIKAAVSEFKGVEHRIEFVREINGIKYYNDSKGTNTDATITALKAFDRGVILLVGGFEKGLDMGEVKKHLGCVKKVIGYGACGKRLVDELVGEDGTVVENLEQALSEANKAAESGDTVLLSPSTSSFDQYTCFEERGEHFKKLVNAL